MVNTCFACKRQAKKEPGRSFHTFPINRDLRQKWLDAIGKSDMAVGSHTALCSLHFEESCFRFGLVRGKKLLKKGSLPTLHLSEDKGSQPSSIEYDPMILIVSKDSDIADQEKEIDPLQLDGEKSLAKEVAIERSGGPIGGGIQRLKRNSDSRTRGGCTETCSERVKELNDLQTLVNKRNSEILMLNRQLQRMHKTATNLKATNKNLKNKTKELENEVTTLKMNIITARELLKDGDSTEKYVVVDGGVIFFHNKCLNFAIPWNIEKRKNQDADNGIKGVFKIENVKSQRSQLGF